MSRSPHPAGGDEDDYREGWREINRRVRAGDSWSGNERHRAFLNLGGGDFADVSAVTGLDLIDDGRAVARVDWDFDGDLDLVLANRTGPRVRVLRNRLQSPHGFLQLRLRGRAPNTRALGARVTVEPADGPGGALVRTRRAGEGFLAQSSAWMHFGLASATRARVTVRWPDGSEESFGELARDRRYVLARGTGRAAAWDPPEQGRPLAAAPVPAPEPPSTARIVLPRPLPMPALAVRTADGSEGSLFGVRSRIAALQRPHAPLLLKLWATWCQPCHAELAAWGAFQDEHPDPGFEMLALGLDPPEARARAREMLQEFGWTAPRGEAAAGSLEILDALQSAVLKRESPIPVPSSFLLDGHGDVVAIYLGPVDPGQVRADLALVTAGPEERRARAAPFPGRWLRPAEDFAVTLGRLEQAFVARGLDRAAQGFQPGYVQLQTGRYWAGRDQLALAEHAFRRALAIGTYREEARDGLAWVHHRLGMDHVERGDFEAARERLRMLRELASPRAGALAEHIRRRQ